MINNGASRSPVVGHRLQRSGLHASARRPPRPVPAASMARLFSQRPHAQHCALLAGDRPSSHRPRYTADPDVCPCSPVLTFRAQQLYLEWWHIHIHPMQCHSTVSLTQELLLLTGQIGDTLEEYLVDATSDPKLRQVLMSLAEAVRTIAFKVRCRATRALKPLTTPLPAHS